MQLDGVHVELGCPSCGARQRCGPTQLLERLSAIGMMKRGSDPDVELLLELVRSAADRLPCQDCRSIGVTVTPITDDDDQWDVVRLCDGCRKPIAAQRLEVFPDATRCATCQTSSETGGDVEREFCDHCGSVLTMRVRRSAGPAAYEMHCPNCRR